MKHQLMFCTLTSVALMIAAACTEDEKGDPCQQAAAVEQEAADGFCSDKTAVCCFCACWEQTAGYHDIDTYLADHTCECAEPPPSDAPVDETCEGEALEDAQACLDDEEACVQPTLELMQVACDGSAI